MSRFSRFANATESKAWQIKGNPKRERGILRLLQQSTNSLRHQHDRPAACLKPRHPSAGAVLSSHERTRQQLVKHSTFRALNRVSPSWLPLRCQVASANSRDTHESHAIKKETRTEPRRAADVFRSWFVDRTCWLEAGTCGSTRGDFLKPNGSARHARSRTWHEARSETTAGRQ